jgi:glycosyltransferase involved in cell wall biosynthesis
MSGATISFLNMVRGICQKGHNVIIAIPCENLVFRNAINEIGGVCVVSKIIPSIFPSEKNKSEKIILVMKLLVLKTWSLINLILVIHKEHPDIVHTNTGVVHEAFWASRLLGYNHIWHLREYQDLDFHWQIVPSKSLFKKTLQKSYVISIAKGIHTYFGLKESPKYRVIYNGILPVSSVSLLMPKEKFFLCSSRVSPEKGHEDVVRCFADFYQSYPDYRLIILGFGDEKYINYLKQICIEYHCENAVSFLGFKKDITLYMKKAKAMIVGSYHEGFGRMTAEAAFCGCIVIGRNTGGTKEIMDATGGLPFSTRYELRSQMEAISLMDTDEYLKRATYAQQQALNLYSNENNIEMIDGFYKDIMFNKKKRNADTLSGECK